MNYNFWDGAVVSLLCLPLCCGVEEKEMLVGFFKLFVGTLNGSFNRSGLNDLQVFI